MRAGASSLLRAERANPKEQGFGGLGFRVEGFRV